MSSYSRTVFDSQLYMIIQWRKMYEPGEKVSKEIQLHAELPSKLSMGGIEPKQYFMNSKKRSQLEQDEGIEIKANG